MERPVQPQHLSQLTASTIYFLQKRGIEIPAELEVPLQKHLAKDWRDVAPPQAAR